MVDAPKPSGRGWYNDQKVGVGESGTEPKGGAPVSDGGADVGGKHLAEHAEMSTRHEKEMKDMNGRHMTEHQSLNARYAGGASGA